MKLKWNWPFADHPNGNGHQPDLPATDEFAPGPDRQFLDVVEEELRPELVAVPIGEIRVRRQVVSEVKTIEVMVRREEVVVERTEAAEQPSLVVFAEGDFPTGQKPGTALGADEEIVRIPLRAEQIVIHKRPVVVEQVVVRKRRVTEAKQISDDLQREELYVEPEGEVEVNDLTAVPTKKGGA
jgi:stress response protein YsnF